MAILRVGVLGAARITPMALIRPARAVSDVVVAAVAAREPARAAAFAAKHGVARAHARVVGEGGELRILNYVAPHVLNRLTVRTAEGTRRERVPGVATYTHQPSRS